MGRYELEYPKDATNLVKRRGERGKFLDQLIHVSFNVPDSPFPVTLPMIGQMGSFDRPSAGLGDPLDLYIHGYVSSRLFTIGRGAGAGAGAVDGVMDGQQRGLPVCCSASHVDGLVLALSAFNHSYNYRSAVLFGHATPVEDQAEKLYAMQLITNSVVPDRWRHTRQPPSKAEMQSTSILRVSIASGSAKIRDGGVSDDVHDLEDPHVRDSVWTGVVPVYSVMGDPVPGPYNCIDMPASARDFVREYGERNQKYSVEAAKGTKGS
ncbi:hypothetical protein E4U21_002596 [Claviceps maximensis]|nr:hypothetical protein E4U21_002596 [Claviceps maximensis]